MSSLVILPVDPLYSQFSSSHGYQKPRYSMNMVGNIFSGFTSCGSLFSNGVEMQEALIVQENVYFSDSDYKSYLTAYKQLAKEYFTERYGLWLKHEMVYFIIDTINADDIILVESEGGRMLQQIGGIGWFGGTTPRLWEDDENMEGTEDTMDYIHQFNFEDNTFQRFNMLKRRDTDSRLERMEVAVAKVNNKEVAEMGLIIDIEDAMKSSTSIKIMNNRFEDTQQQLGYHDLEGRFQQCSLILTTEADFAQMNVQSADINQDKYYQLSHIIKVRNITKSKIVIAGNTFFKISVTGPPILLHEQFQQAFNKFIILNNTFRLIHGYINSNVIQISRECEETNKAGQIFEDPILKNDFSKEQVVMVMRSFMGGNILIRENNFSEIAGCPTVAAGAIMISVRISSEFEEGNALGISFEERDDIITDISHPQYKNALMILSLEFAQKCQSELVKIVEIGGEYGTVNLHRQNVVLKGNTYTNMSMGVRRNLIEDNYEIQGALIKIVNIMSTRISNEKFENIGAYTIEHSKDLLSKIFSKPLSYFCDNEKTQLYGMINMYSWIYMFDLNNLDFMKKYLSTSLIATHQTYSFMLGPSNSFINIWLVDKYEALSRSQQLGVLLYMNYHFGRVNLGHERGQTLVQNIVGMINSFTMERFPFWHPNDFQYVYVPQDFESPYQQKISVTEGNMINGASSIVFNIHNPNNFFPVITVCNIYFDRIYHKPLNQYVDLVKIPSIISTVQDSGAFTGSINKVILKDLTLSNSQFEHSSGYFDLQAKDLQISGFRVYNIGNWRMFDDPEWQRWEESNYSYILLAIPASIFKLRMFAYADIQQNIIILSSAVISDSYFSNIEIYKGALPIFEIDVVKDSRRGLDALMVLDNITLEDSQSSSSDASKCITLNSFLQLKFLPALSYKLSIKLKQASQLRYKTSKYRRLKVNVSQIYDNVDRWDHEAIWQGQQYQSVLLAFQKCDWPLCYSHVYRQTVIFFTVLHQLHFQRSPSQTRHLCIGIVETV
ncbi:hypothetical protein FGO68_gene13762 [Halteria grandinella]|uniref:Uncharacterized protein n=1 Tax=Halteria grandinella TaxID=5974 RepID=A0A8J8P936_HALGN|nr:hypothetical protein FGO68_gene13762 [Halteria grandinella]